MVEVKIIFLKAAHAMLELASAITLWMCMMNGTLGPRLPRYTKASWATCW